MQQIRTNEIWKYWDTKDKKWATLPRGRDRMTEYLAEGYKYKYNGSDNSCIKCKSTFTLFSNNANNVTQDLCHIYKDDRKYTKKAFKTHNDGYNNYTIHMIRFKAKQIGKILGITYNKEITMDGNNNLICGLKELVDENRKSFTTKKKGDKYEKLFQKAIDNNIIDWKTCNIEMLPESYKRLRSNSQSDSDSDLSIASSSNDVLADSIIETPDNAIQALVETPEEEEDSEKMAKDFAQYIMNEIVEGSFKKIKKEEIKIKLHKIIDSL